MQTRISEPQCGMAICDARVHARRALCNDTVLTELPTEVSATNRVPEPASALAYIAHLPAPTKLPLELRSASCGRLLRPGRTSTVPLALSLFSARLLPCLSDALPSCETVASASGHISPPGSSVASPRSILSCWPWQRAPASTVRTFGEYSWFPSENRTCYNISRGEINRTSLLLPRGLAQRSTACRRRHALNRPETRPGGPRAHARAPSV